MLSDHLTRQGIAVLRFDKRGMGQSSGNYKFATSEDFANDVVAGIEYLKTRKEFQQIGLIGHSEGGLVAYITASRVNNVAFLVSMAGPGVNGEKILYEQGTFIQRVDGVPEAIIVKNRQLQEAVFEIVKNESDLALAEKLLKQATSTHPDLDSQDMEAMIQRVNTPLVAQFLTTLSGKAHGFNRGMRASTSCLALECIF